MTLIVAMKCIDGVVIVGDRKVTNSKRLTDKIRKPDEMNVVFSAGGFERLFEDYLDQLQQAVEFEYNWYEEQNKEKPESLHREYSSLNFKQSCVKTLEQLKEIHKSVGENIGFEQALQVFFTLFEKKNGKFVTSLYKMDMDDCLPERVEDGVVETIGYSQLAKPLLQSINNKPELKMKEVARVAAFAIKYIEKEGLTDGVGVEPLEPQIWFIPENEVPREIVKDELKQLLQNVNDEVEKMRNLIGSTSRLLRS